MMVPDFPTTHAMSSASPHPARNPAQASLRDALLTALCDIPGVRFFHLHVLVSAPRRHNALFQFAKPRPRTYVQDVLILCSEQIPSPLSKTRSSVDKSDEEPRTSQRVLLTAIEATIYHVPATSSSILYICKVDSTGHVQGKSPTTALVRAFLKYYADPKTRPGGARNLWIQLFARAQGQYLFPNSSHHVGKRPLSDMQLCTWWKRVLSDVALDLLQKDPNGVTGSTAPTKSSSPPALESKTTSYSQSGIDVQAYYILPGFSQLEAEYSLKVASPSSNIPWAYGHPYAQKITSLPCPPDTQNNLGHYIPYFDDDPKSRFMDEIAYTTGGEVKSPVRKRARTASSVDDAKDREAGKDKDKPKEREKDEKPLGELGKVTPDEFWERMSFRQECVAGAVTGFFTLIVSMRTATGTATQQRSETRSKEDPQPPPQETHLQTVVPARPEAPTIAGQLSIETQPGQVSPPAIKRVLTALTTGVEFSTAERAVKATETIENTIKGLCESISATSALGTSQAQSCSNGNERSVTPEPMERAEANSTSASAVVSTERRVPPSTPPRNPAKRRADMDVVTPNPFPEPVVSLETYHMYIYGSVEVRNTVTERSTCGGVKGTEGDREGLVKQAAAAATAPAVTVLTARKKKKRVD